MSIWKIFKGKKEEEPKYEQTMNEDIEQTECQKEIKEDTQEDVEAPVSEETELVTEEEITIEESEEFTEVLTESLKDELIKKEGVFAKIAAGLTKTRNNMAELFISVFSGSLINDEFYEELEEALIVADVGVVTTDVILEQLRAKIKEEKLTQPEQAREKLKQIIADMVRPEIPFETNQKSVILVVGVNGVGKTTTIGKMASLYQREGKSVILAAADTFRAAAAEQLTEWGKRAKVSVIKHGEGADPAAVVYDAISSAKARDADLLICDTAGRLHNKKNLMNELGKIGRVIEKEYEGVHKEILLVLDATTGQNAVSQTRTFAETVPVTGIVLTKLDGTAKGGVVIAVCRESGIPVRFVGVGEGKDDLEFFDPDAFAAALF